MEGLESYLSFFDREEWWWEWLLALFLFLFFLLLRNLFSRRLFHLILRFIPQGEGSVAQSLLHAFQRPFNTFFILLGLYLALRMLSPLAPYGGTLTQLFRGLVFLLAAWGFYNLSSTSSALLLRVGEKLDLNMDRIVIPFLSKALRLVIVALTVVVLLDQLNYNVGGFIAGLGLGGLAVSLAAKETLGNIFGGLVIITEKPFSLGDWIETPTVEGVVEDISFRSTKVRTFSHALVTVPNSTLANEAITNWSRMGRRRVTFHLGVSHSSPRERLARSVERIRHLLQNHPEIDQQTLFVHFDRFGESSFDIFLYFFTRTTDWGEWLKIKEEINFKILEILEEEGIAIAAPSRRLYVEGRPPGEEAAH